MTEEEYMIKKMGIEIEAKCKQDALDVQYVVDNCPYKYGDIVEDHIGRMKIEKRFVTPALNRSTPTCYFTGTELKKDNTPKKRQDLDRRVYWENIINRI